ncbi:hypothetical protein Tco_0749510 [Tanacetum coccineum]|uniref:Uncharacterized protein n=1 Tax=Tanacetum coccineum TaxID=301880 RepID=A0ABQ4YYL6_9ASTR
MTPDLTCPSTYQLLQSSPGCYGPNMCFNMPASLEYLSSLARASLAEELSIDYGPTPFRFFHSWFNWDDFDKMVEDTWKSLATVDLNAIRGTHVDGEWIVDPLPMKSMFLKYFSTQFSSSVTPRICFADQFTNSFVSFEMLYLKYFLTLRKTFGIKVAEDFVSCTLAFIMSLHLLVEYEHVAVNLTRHGLAAATVGETSMFKRLKKTLGGNGEKFGWWFEQDIDGKSEDDNEKKLVMSSHLPNVVHVLPRIDNAAKDEDPKCWTACYRIIRRGTGVRVGRGGRGRRPKEGNDERVEDLNAQGNDQGLGANWGVEGVNGNVEGANEEIRIVMWLMRTFRRTLGM